LEVSLYSDDEHPRRRAQGEIGFGVTSDGFPYLKNGGKIVQSAPAIESGIVYLLVAKVAVSTELLKTQAKMGEGVTLRAHVENKTAEGIPMTLARIGLPGGTVFQTWQLKELKDKGLIDFYETRPREVILYWRALAPGAKKDIDLNLLSAVPGSYEAPASSAYLYYTAEDKAWTAPVKVTVEK